MKRSLKVMIALVGSLAGLTVVLVGLALAGNAPPRDSSSSPPPAQPPEPGSGVYTLYDTLTPGDTPPAVFDWQDIENDADQTWDFGNDFIEDSNVSPRFALDFVFPFYNELYTEFRISERGYIFFEKEGVDVGGGDVPAEIPTNDLGGLDGANNFIAPFAGDLFGYPRISQAYVKNETAPRRTIIQFENIMWCCNQFSPRTFQVILYPDGAIEMQYRRIPDFPGSSDLDAGQQVIVGLETVDGSKGDVYTQGIFVPTDSTYWQDRLAVRYERSLTQAMALFLPAEQRVWDDPGRLITLRPVLYLLADPSLELDFDIMTDSLEISSTLPAGDWAANITSGSIMALSGTYSATVPLELTVPDGAGLSDVATATFIAEAVGSPVTATFSVVYGPAQRDLQLEKTLDPAIPPAENGALRYRLTATNTDYNNSDRAGVARGVVVTDTLPAGLVYEACRRGAAYQNCDSEITTSPVGSKTLVTWDIGDLNVDQPRTIYLELRNTNPQGTPVNNTAAITLTDGLEIGYPARNQVGDSFTVAAAASELNVRKVYPHSFNDQNFIGAGQVIPFDIRYFNDGREGRRGNVPISATLVDVLPPGVTFDRATTGDDYDDPQITPIISGPFSRTLTFDNVAVDNGHWNRNRIRIWVTVPQTTPVGSMLTNEATLSDGDSTATDQETVEVASNFADPFVRKSPSVDAQDNVIAPEPGRDYTYLIDYGNRSMLTEAANFELVDTLPAEATYIESVAIGPDLDGPITSTVGDRTVLRWTKDRLPPAATGQILVVVSFPDDLPPGAALVNEVAIDYTGTFSPSTEMDDTDTLTVEIASQLNGSAKRVDDSTPNAGETVEYTIIVSNTGETALPFIVTDTLPAALTYVADPPATASAGTATINNGVIAWSGDVGQMSQETLTFRAIVDENAQIDDVIKNTAQIKSGDIEINRSVAVTVVGGVFGGSGKTAEPDPVISGSRLTYRLTARNTGSAGGAITVTDTLPASVTLVAGSFRPASEASNVTVSPDERSFTWQTTVEAAGEKQLNFEVTVASGLADGVTIENRAFLDSSGIDTNLPLTAVVTIDNSIDIYLPIILKR